MFLGYPNGTRGDLFYIQTNNKLFFSTNVGFTKDDYMNNFTPQCRVVLEEIANGFDGQIPKTFRDEEVVFGTP